MVKLLIRQLYCKTCPLEKQSKEIEMAKNKNFVPDQQDDALEEPTLLELTDMDGNEVLYELLDVVPLNEKEYIVVVPYVEGESDAVEEVEIYEIVPDEEEDTETYVGLKSAEEVDQVYQEFKKRSEEFFSFED